MLGQCKSYTFNKLNHQINHISHIEESDTPSLDLLSTFFLNIDGNQTNFDHLLCILKGINHSFSAIGLAETNIEPDSSMPYTMHGFTSFYQKTREGKSKGTGVALYLHESLNGSIVDNVSLCSTDIESLIIKITNLAKPIYIGVIYRPNDGDLDGFNTKLSEIFASLPQNSTYIMGDYNIDLLKNKPNQEYEEAIYSAGFSPLISIATHQRPNSKDSCIDNIFTNEPESVILSGTLSDNITHHLPIFQFSNIKTPHREIKEKTTQYYDFSNKNVNNFTMELSESIHQLNPSTDFSEFSSLFESIVDKHCKLSKPKTTKRTTNNNPWITDSIIQAIEYKHELKKAWSKTTSKKRPAGRHDLYEKFKAYRSTLKSLIRTAKSTFYTKRISDSTNDRKKTWKIINELRGKRNTKLKPQFLINNEKITNRRVIANEFNKYFVSIASKLNEGINEVSLENHNLPTFHEYLNPPNQNSIFMQDCDEKEVVNIIKVLQNGKSSDIPIKIIKKCAQIISPKLSQYYNILMANGIFPDNLKTGRITPVFKKGDSELLENYRPISTLPILGKIFEKIIYSRLYSFFSSQNAIYDNQYGFRKNHSTSHAVNHSITHITNQLSQNKYVLGIFIDLSKAFDTIDHQKLVVEKADRGDKFTIL